MGRVRQKDTRPEIKVRRLIHSLGYRFRLHRRDLPGNPDIVLPRHRKAIFVHGCFWHGHNCRRGAPPSSNQDFWGPKLEKNRARDSRVVRELQNLNWRVLVLWECEIADDSQLAERLVNFLKEGDSASERI